MTGKSSKTHYLAKSRQVLEINDEKKLLKLLAQQKAELQQQYVSFGKKKMGDLHAKGSASAIRKHKKNIARIRTRLSQLNIKRLKKW